MDRQYSLNNEENLDLRLDFMLDILFIMLIIGIVIAAFLQIDSLSMA